MSELSIIIYESGDYREDDRADPETSAKIF